VGLAVWGTATGRPVLAWLGVPAGIAVGAACGWLLGGYATRRLSDRGPELLALLRHGRPETTSTVTGLPPMPRWAAAVTVTFWIAGWIPLFPQGIVPAVFTVLGVDARAWFLALYLPGPWRWPVIVAMVLLGLGMLATAWWLPRRYTVQAAAPAAGGAPVAPTDPVAPADPPGSGVPGAPAGSVPAGRATGE
jgi:ABC-2 type transport system permease protein